mgnify:CR=1 FL=1
MEKEKLDKMYDICFFDLDGTIIDSSPGITNSVMYALEKFGIEETEREKLYKFIGPIRSPDSMDLTMRKAGRRWSITGNIIRIRGFLSVQCIPDLKNH